MTATPNNSTPTSHGPVHEAGRNPSIRAPGIRAALAGIFVNALLALAKLVAGLVGNSYALVADAVESIADIASSTAVLGGLAVAAKPPDRNHPYGHGRAESLAALAVAFMLLGSAVGIAIQAVREIITPHHVPAGFTLVVLAGVVAVKETLYRFVGRVGRETDSTAVQTDAWHHRSDALTSLAAAVGITIALLGGDAYAAADDWAALAACGVIAFNGSRFLRKAVDELMDIRPDTAFLADVRTSAKGVPRVLGVEKLLARRMGSRYLIDLHLEVDPNCTVAEGHDIAHRVKDALLLRHERIADVLIHVEPFGGPRQV